MDVSKIKKRLNALQSTQDRKSDFWKPQFGTQRIRIVPYKYEPSYPFIELYFHYGLGGKTYLSPITFGEPDPIAEFAEKLRKQGDKESWNQSRNFLPKLRTFAPVIVRGEEKEGVRFWGFGKTVYQEILTFMAEPEYGDITDPLTGSDIIINYTSAEDAGSAFPQTKIMVARKESPLHDDEETAKKFLEEQKNITELYKVLSYDELKVALDKWLSGETDEDDDSNSDDDSDDEMPVTTQKSKATQQKVSDEFSKLFDDDLPY